MLVIRKHLKTQHLRPESDGDGVSGTVESAGTAVPAFIRILDHGSPLFLIKMDHIHRTVEITNPTPVALLQIYHRRHTQTPFGHSSVMVQDYP
jgi:hypothetical protein